MAVPRVLVLLASHNGADWIEEQINSIFAQAIVHVHVIVRDDGSADSTCALLSRFQDPRLTVMPGSVPTGSAAQNFLSMIRGNAASDFDFIAFSDQDDVWNLDKLSRATHSLTATTSAGYSSATLAYWDESHTKVLNQHPVATASDFLFEGAGQGCTFVLTQTFYSRLREFLIYHGALTTQLHYHDWAIYALARAWREVWFFDPEPSMKYRQHGRNDTGGKYSLKGVGKRLKLMKSGWYAAQIKTIADLVLSASPDNLPARQWSHLAATHPESLRRFKTLSFCLQGGRRKVSDRSILIGAAMLGWI